MDGFKISSLICDVNCSLLLEKRKILEFKLTDGPLIDEKKQK
jgi:hypothetical protein